MTTYETLTPPLTLHPSTLPTSIPGSRHQMPRLHDSKHTSHQVPKPSTFVRGNKGILKAFSSRNTTTQNNTKKDFVCFKSDLGYNGRKCHTGACNYYTGLCLLKIKNSFIFPSQEPSLLEEKTPTRPSPSSEVPELNARSGQA